MSNNFWRSKKVFLTGHTGFKGSWLCLWLNSLGAKVTGYSLEPPTDLFPILCVRSWAAAYKQGKDARAICLKQIEEYNGV